MIHTLQLPAQSLSQRNDYTTLSTPYQFTGRQNIIKHSNIPLLLDVIHSYVVMPYWLEETPCALFWCK